MTTRGPIPKPAAVSERDGNPGHRSHRRRAPIVTIDPTDGPPAVPDGLDATGTDAWDRWWRSATWLAPSDWTGVHVLCQMLDAAESMRRQIAKDGRTAKGSRGQPVAHPLIAPLQALDGALLHWLGDYGFTPAGRARLRIELVQRREPSILDKYQSPYAHLKVDQGDRYAHLKGDQDA